VNEETNWAGTYVYGAKQILNPTSVDEVQEIVAGSDRVRPLGSRHSFNDVADTTGSLVSLQALPERVDIDPDARTVTVSSGLRHGDVAVRLQAEGWALHNLASLPHISVAGAIATATHGSGDRNGNLATEVAGLELVTGNGELVTVRRGDPDFDGVVVGIGALGIVTAVTLDIEPTFQISQRAYSDLPWDGVLANLDAATGAGYSVSLFTDWRGDTVRQAWVKSLSTDDGPGDVFLGGRAETVPVHMLPGVSPVNTTQQLGVPGPWHERLPHFRLEFTPSNGEEIQSEFLVQRKNAVAAIEALRGLGGLLAPALQTAEIRTMAADRLWLSAAYDGGANDADRTGTVGFHFTWKKLQDEVLSVLPAVENALAPFQARPHWGKVFVDADGVVPSLYPRMGDFRSLVERYDPRGVFTNAFLERHILA
jgi:xylitol oxidase